MPQFKPVYSISRWVLEFSKLLLTITKCSEVLEGCKASVTSLWHFGRHVHYTTICLYTVNPFSMQHLFQAVNDIFIIARVNSLSTSLLCNILVCNGRQLSTLFPVNHRQVRVHNVIVFVSSSPLDTHTLCTQNNVLRFILVKQSVECASK